MALQSFVVVRYFTKLCARLHVDCYLKEASVTITWQHVIRCIRPVPFHEVDTPDKAEAWFGKTASAAHGSWLEFHAFMCAKDMMWLRDATPQPPGRDDT